MASGPTEGPGEPGKGPGGSGKRPEDVKVRVVPTGAAAMRPSTSLTDGKGTGAVKTHATHTVENPDGALEEALRAAARGERVGLNAQAPGAQRAQNTDRLFGQALAAKIGAEVVDRENRIPLKGAHALVDAFSDRLGENFGQMGLSLIVIATPIDGAPSLNLNLPSGIINASAKVTTGKGGPVLLSRLVVPSTKERELLQGIERQNMAQLYQVASGTGEIYMAPFADHLNIYGPKAQELEDKVTGKISAGTSQPSEKTSSFKSSDHAIRIPARFMRIPKTENRTAFVAQVTIDPADGFSATEITAMQTALARKIKSQISVNCRIVNDGFTTTIVHFYETPTQETDSARTEIERILQKFPLSTVATVQGKVSVRQVGNTDMTVIYGEAMDRLAKFRKDPGEWNLDHASKTILENEREASHLGAEIVEIPGQEDLPVEERAYRFTRRFVPKHFHDSLRFSGEMERAYIPRKREEESITAVMSKTGRTRSRRLIVRGNHGDGKSTTVAQKTEKEKVAMVRYLGSEGKKGLEDKQDELERILENLLALCLLAQCPEHDAEEMRENLRERRTRIDEIRARDEELLTNPKTSKPFDMESKLTEIGNRKITAAEHASRLAVKLGITIGIGRDDTDLMDQRSAQAEVIFDEAFEKDMCTPGQYGRFDNLVQIDVLRHKGRTEILHSQAHKRILDLIDAQKNGERVTIVNFSMLEIGDYDEKNDSVIPNRDMDGFFGYRLIGNPRARIDFSVYELVRHFQGQIEERPPEKPGEAPRKKIVASANKMVSALATLMHRKFNIDGQPTKLLEVVDAGTPTPLITLNPEIDMNQAKRAIAELFEKGGASQETQIQNLEIERVNIRTKGLAGRILPLVHSLRGMDQGILRAIVVEGYQVDAKEYDKAIKELRESNIVAAGEEINFTHSSWYLAVGENVAATTQTTAAELALVALENIRKNPSHAHLAKTIDPRRLYDLAKKRQNPTPEQKENLLAYSIEAGNFALNISDHEYALACAEFSFEATNAILISAATARATGRGINPDKLEKVQTMNREARLLKAQALSYQEKFEESHAILATLGTDKTLTREQSLKLFKALLTNGYFAHLLPAMSERPSENGEQLYRAAIDAAGSLKDRLVAKAPPFQKEYLEESHDLHLLYKRHIDLPKAPAEEKRGLLQNLETDAESAVQRIETQKKAIAEQLSRYQEQLAAAEGIIQEEFGRRPRDETRLRSAYEEVKKSERLVKYLEEIDDGFQELYSSILHFWSACQYEKIRSCGMDFETLVLSTDSELPEDINGAFTLGRALSEGARKSELSRGDRANPGTLAKVYVQRALFNYRQTADPEETLRAILAAEQRILVTRPGHRPQLLSQLGSITYTTYAVHPQIQMEVAQGNFTTAEQFYNKCQTTYQAARKLRPEGLSQVYNDQEFQLRRALLVAEMQNPQQGAEELIKVYTDIHAEWSKNRISSKGETYQWKNHVFASHYLRLLDLMATVFEIFKQKHGIDVLQTILAKIAGDTTRRQVSKATQDAPFITDTPLPPPHPRELKITVNDNTRNALTQYAAQVRQMREYASQNRPTSERPFTVGGQYNGLYRPQRVRAHGLSFAGKINGPSYRETLFNAA